MHFALKIFTDGASKGNPGLASSGFVVYNLKDNEEVFRHGEVIGHQTNNTAEWTAVLLAVKYLISILERFPTAKMYIKVFTDSMLVVKQFAGQYGIKQEKLQEIKAQVDELLLPYESQIIIAVEHIGRDKNREADALCNRVIKQYLGKESLR